VTADFPVGIAISLLAAWVFLLLCPGAAADEPARKPAVHVSADQLTVDHGRKQALFKGRVAVKYGALELRCAELQVGYGEDGQVQSLRALGGVVVEKQGARAEAATARLDVSQGLLVLEGRPVLTRGPHRIQGQRIEVDLDAVEIRVLGARGRFQLALEPGR
jgi:lipopolysaccharide transport protein LptA